MLEQEFLRLCVFFPPPREPRSVLQLSMKYHACFTAVTLFPMLCCKQVSNTHPFSYIFAKSLSGNSNQCNYIWEYASSEYNICNITQDLPVLKWCTFQNKPHFHTMTWGSWMKRCVAQQVLPAGT